MNKDKIKILKFIQGSKTVVNNIHISEKFPTMKNYFKYTSELFNDGYIEKHPNALGYQLTTLGRRKLESQRDKIINDIKYAITTFIAVLALIISLVS